MTGRSRTCYPHRTMSLCRLRSAIPQLGLYPLVTCGQATALAYYTTAMLACPLCLTCNHPRLTDNPHEIHTVSRRFLPVAATA